jgi:hypothetical protein
MAAAVGLLSVMPAIAVAQVAASLDVGGGLGRVGSNAWLRESRVTPTLSFAHQLGTLRFDGDAIERNGQLLLRRTSIEGALHSPAVGIFRATLAGNYLRDVAQPNNPATSASVLAALSAKVGATGAWVGTSRPSNAPLQLNLGAWRSLGSAVFSITSQTQLMRVSGPRTYQWRDSTYIDTDTLDHWSYGPWQTATDGNVTRQERWSDVEARVDWSHDRLSLSAAMSGRRARDSIAAKTWGRATATYQVTARMALVAGGGTVPAATRSGVASSRFATFGLRFAPAALLRPALPPAVRPSATAIVVRAVAPGSYKVTLRVPNARTVELSGDFNQWAPVSLRETQPNVWEVTLPMKPGVHHVNVRIDGDAWTAPPGLPATDDEFNGRVGILIVR